MRDRAKRDRERRARNTKRGSLRNVTQTADQPTLTTYATETIEPVPEASLLLDACPLEEGAGSRWHLYHTPTGRLTGFLRERQRLSSRRGGDQSLPQPPWRPPYTSPARGSSVGDSFKTKQQNSNTPKLSNKEDDREIDVGVKGEAEGENESDSTYTSWSDVSEDDGNEVGERRVNENTQCPERHCSARDMLIEGAEMRQRTISLTERYELTHCLPG